MSRSKKTPISVIALLPAPSRSTIQYHPFKTSYVLATCLESNQIILYNTADNSQQQQQHQKKENNGNKFSHHNEHITSCCISPKGDCVASASLDKTVVQFSLRFNSTSTSSNSIKKTLLTYNSGNASALAFNSTGSSLAAGSIDVIKQVNMVDNAQVITFKAHDGQVQSIAYSPNGKYMATIGAEDNTLKLWSTDKLSSDEAIFEREVTANCQMSWKPDSSHLAISSTNSVICLSATANWDLVSSFEDDGHTREVTALAWCPNGIYLVSVAQDKNLLVWNTNTLQQVAQYRHDCTISSIAWKPDGNCLSFIDTKGQLGTYWNVIPSTLVSPLDQAAIDRSKELMELFDDDEDIDMKVQSNTPMSRLRKPIMNDTVMSPKGDSDENDYEAVDEDEEDEEEEEHDYESELEEIKFVGGSGKKTSRSIQSNINTTAITTTLSSFQPGSTSHLTKRRYFMAYNMIGMIIKREEDDTNKAGSIEIEFSETSFHRKITMPDNSHFDLASLGRKGAIFASSTESTLCFKPFDSLGGIGNEWTLHSEGDPIVGVAIGERFITSCSKSRILRVFTLGGIQSAILSIDGDLVTMAINGNDQLAIVYSSNNGLILNYIDLNNGKQLYQGCVPVSPQSELKWLGFSDSSNQLTTYDSNGMIRILAHAWPNAVCALQWMPLMVMKSKRSSSHWIVGLNDSHDYPLTIPRPTLSTIPINHPLLPTPEVTSHLEETLYKNRQSYNRFSHSNRSTVEDLVLKEQAAYDSDVLRLFGAIIKSGKSGTPPQSQRCFELCQMLKLEKSLNIAFRVANDHKASDIASRINTLVDKFQEERTSQSQRHSQATLAVSQSPSPDTTVRQVLDSSSKENEHVVISPASKTTKKDTPVSASKKETKETRPTASTLVQQQILFNKASSPSKTTSATVKSSTLPFPKLNVTAKKTESTLLSGNKKRKETPEDNNSNPFKLMKKT
ncbi:hypothetical protein SAMD00019534_117430 [Acytostelium subglobosum LB1]|uniref:hypothetical protein n=1 Tax=Acytostelium subglobosum LB1 TaxID=1410327 RepID=UPI000644DD91|nr:hypothetical protein SAMD00019534_117430 [Acytostelium subglobosum LB1]GAM28567.1 hypothetical protein SAMD00019534_117430 [Acytostelium subglobosum LB1]|eukprot:XP_012748606.1 hypothetical protein SAMD00019534_117430 [Acytostelium subglobosum LB1]